MPDCRKIASNFSNFMGEAPDPPSALATSALGSGLRPLTGPLLSKIPGSAPEFSVWRTTVNGQESPVITASETFPSAGISGLVGLSWVIRVCLCMQDYKSL